MFSPADEAYCLLCMMNYWDKWEYLANKSEIKEDDSSVSQRHTYWTTSSKDPNDTNDQGNHSFASTSSAPSSSKPSLSNMKTNILTREKRRRSTCSWNKEGRTRFHILLQYIATKRKRRNPAEDNWKKH